MRNLIGMFMLRQTLGGALAAVIALSAAPALADEGMWTFDNFPAAKVAQAYGVKQVQSLPELTAAVREALSSAAARGRFAR